MAVSVRLEDYDIDPVRGFLPGRDPLTALPAPFAAWDEVAAQLPLLVMNGRALGVLEALPVLNANGLKSVEEQRRGLLLLAGFANTWMALGGSNTLPRGIAMPLIDVARTLGVAPITTHATIVLGNWQRIDPNTPLSLDNVDTLLSFRGSIDEKWFFLATAGVELAGAPVLARLVEAIDAAEVPDEARLTRELTAIAGIIEQITVAFMRVRESCDPFVFYKHVRPFLAGWPASGVVYEGTGIGPIQYSGASAAQSALLQAIDAALGIGHQHDLTKPFLTSMRDYMPPRHRAFLEVIGERSRVRAVVTAPDAPQALRQAYDAAVAAMDGLRRKHIGLVSEYITKQMPPNATAVGTGGTSFDDFLRQARIETVTSKVGGQR